MADKSKRVSFRGNNTLDDPDLRLGREYVFIIKGRVGDEGKSIKKTTGQESYLKVDIEVVDIATGGEANELMERLAAIQAERAGEQEPIPGVIDKKK